MIEIFTPVWSRFFYIEVNEVAIPYSHSDVDSEGFDEETQIDPVDTEPVIVEQTGSDEVVETNESTPTVEETGSKLPEPTVSAPTILNHESTDYVVENLQVESYDFLVKTFVYRNFITKGFDRI